MASKTQSGFSAVIGVVAIVLVIGVLGLISWRLYNHSSTKTNDATTTNQNTNQSPISKSNQSAATQLAPTFVIKEWDVQFKPANGLDGLKYAIRFNNQQAIFSTPSITAIDAKCSEQTNGFSGIGSLDRFAVGTEQPLNDTPITTINGYSYYYSVSGGGDCVSDTNNTAGQTLLRNQQQNLSSSIISLQSAQ